MLGHTLAIDRDGFPVLPQPLFLAPFFQLHLQRFFQHSRRIDFAGTGIDEQVGLDVP
jgi:hypothetical protein